MWVYTLRCTLYTKQEAAILDAWSSTPTLKRIQLSAELQIYMALTCSILIPTQHIFCWPCKCARYKSELDLKFSQERETVIYIIYIIGFREMGHRIRSRQITGTHQNIRLTLYVYGNRILPGRYGKHGNPFISLSSRKSIRWCCEEKQRNDGFETHISNNVKTIFSVTASLTSLTEDLAEAVSVSWTNQSVRSRTWHLVNRKNNIIRRTISAVLSWASPNTVYSRSALRLRAWSHRQDTKRCHSKRGRRSLRARSNNSSA